MSRKLIGIFAGGALLVPGLLVPSALLIELLHGPAGELQQQLMLGAALFRGVLVVTGLYFILLGFLPFAGTSRDREEMVEAGSGARLLILLALVILAFVARLYRLDQGIWLDEIFAYVHYVSQSAGRIFTTFDDPNNHLFYTLSASLSIDLFGEGTWALRLPAAVFGVACVPALYYFARQVSSVRESLFSAALLAFAYHHVWFSQNARGYTALLFFSLLSSAFLVRAMRSGSMREWLFYAVAAALGVMTHLTMGFVSVAQFAVYMAPIVTGRSAQQGLDRWSGFLGGFVTGGLLSILAYAFVLPQMLGGGLVSGTEGTVEEWTNPVWMVLEVIRGLQIGFAGGLVALVAFTVFALGMIDYSRKQPVVPALLLVSSVLGFLVMISINYTLFPRFFFFAMGFAVIIVIRGAMLTGTGIGRLLRLPRAENGWPGSVLCAGLVAVAVLSMPLAYGPKQDYEGALQFVERERVAGDTVVTVGIADYPYGSFYSTDWVAVDSLEKLNKVRAQSSRTWMVYTMPMHTESAFPDIFASLEKDFDVVERFPGTLNGGEVVVCRTRL